MDKNQVQGITERIIYGVVMGILTKLVAKGYIDQDMAAYVAAGAVTAAGAAYGWWVNRPKALAEAVAKPGTMVVTDAATANSTSNPNVVSNADVKVVNK